MKTKIIKVSWFKANVKGYVIHRNKVWNIINIVDSKDNKEIIDQHLMYIDGVTSIILPKRGEPLSVIVEYVMSVRKLKKLIFEKVLTDQKIIEEIVLKDKDFGEVIEDIAFDEVTNFMDIYNKNKKPGKKS